MVRTCSCVCHRATTTTTSPSSRSVSRLLRAPPGRGTVGMYHLAWEVPTLAELEQMRETLAAAGALRGASDHGANKSLYAVDPDGLEFEVMWLVPAEHWGSAEHEVPDHPAARPARRASGVGDHIATATFDPSPARRSRPRSASASPRRSTPASSPRAPRCRPSGCCARSSAWPARRCARRSRVSSSPATSSAAATAPSSPTAAGVNFAGDDRKALVRQLFEVRQVIEPAIAELARPPGHRRRARRDRRARRARSPRELDEFREIDRSSTPRSPGRAATRC